MGEDLRKIFLTGLGALVVSSKKTKEIIDILMAKGELTIEQYKAMNQELKRNTIKSMAEKNNRTPNKPNFSQILSGINSLTPEELSTLESKLSDLKKTQ